MRWYVLWSGLLDKKIWQNCTFRGGGLFHATYSSSLLQSSIFDALALSLVLNLLHYPNIIASQIDSEREIE